MFAGDVRVQGQVQLAETACFPPVAQQCAEVVMGHGERFFPDAPILGEPGPDSITSRVIDPAGEALLPATAAVVNTD
jgi:hypothetical protein